MTESASQIDSLYDVEPELELGFRTEILEALPKVPLLPPAEDSPATSQVAAPRAERSRRATAVNHEEVLVWKSQIQPWEVTTDDPEKYHILLALAYVVIAEVDYEFGIPRVSLRERLDSRDHKDLHAHEMVHVSRAKAYDLPGILYGVKFKREVQRDGRWRYFFNPFIELTGRVKKIHAADIFLAPGDPSEDDIQVVRDMGYDPEDRERIHRLATTTPPCLQ